MKDTLQKLVNVFKSLYKDDADKSKLFDDINFDDNKDIDLNKFNKEAMSPEAIKVFEALKLQNETLVNQVKELSNTITSVAQKEKEREDNIKAEALKKRNEEIDNIINEMKKVGKIPANDEKEVEKFKKLLSADFENGKAVIEKIPATIKQKSEDNSQKHSNNNNQQTETKLSAVKPQYIDYIKKQISN